MTTKGEAQGNEADLTNIQLQEENTQKNTQVQMLHLDKKQEEHITSTAKSGIQKIMLIILIFTLLMFLLNLALVIAAMAALSLDTKCVTWNDGDNDVDDVEDETNVWFIVYVVFNMLFWAVYLNLIIIRQQSTKQGVSSSSQLYQKLGQFLNCFTCILSMQFLTCRFLFAWHVWGSVLRWDKDNYECPDDKVEDALYGVLVIYWISYGFYFIFCLILACTAKESLLEMFKFKK